MGTTLEMCFRKISRVWNGGWLVNKITNPADSNVVLTQSEGKENSEPAGGLFCSTLDFRKIIKIPVLSALPNFHHSFLSAYCVSVQFSHSVVSDSLRPHGLHHQASLSITSSQSLVKLMSIKSVMPSNHLILCCPLLLLSSIFPSIRIFSKESDCHIRWPKYRSSALASVIPMNVQDWISFRIDWFDLAVQGTLKSLLQHYSSKASINNTVFSLGFIYMAISWFHRSGVGSRILHTSTHSCLKTDRRE